MNRERRWLLLFAVVTLTVTSLPYLIGFSQQGSEWRFTGFVFGVEDGNSYIAKMLSGANGAWLFRTPYTAYPQRGFLAFFPYILLGKLTSPAGQHEQLVAIYHLFRWLAGFLLIFAVYDFGSLFTPSLAARRWITLVATLGGGLGWLPLVGQSGWWGKELPLEFYSPETFGFLSLYGIPHLAAARALLMWGLASYLASSRRSFERQAALRTGGLWLIMGLMQPQSVALGWVVIGIHLVALVLYRFAFERMPRRCLVDSLKAPAQNFMWIAAISSPIVLYNLVAFQVDSYLSQWLAQNLILSPSLLHYVFAYGVLLPPAVAGALRLLQGDAEKGVFLTAWVIALPLLAYAPYNLQRRLVEGGWVALTALAVIGAFNLRGYWHKAAAVLLGSTLLPSLVLVAGGVQAARSPTLPLFRPAAEVSAIQFLAENAGAGAVVLASHSTSNAIPTWAPLRTIIGHGAESAGLQTLLPRVRRFYQSQIGDEERLALIAEHHIAYILWGALERDLGDWQPQLAAYLKRVYRQGGYEIYEVLPMLQGSD